MTAVLFRQRTPEIDAWLAERKRLGLDRRDEIWEGTYVVNPSPSGRHAWLAAQLVRIFWGPAEARGLRAIEQANIGTPDDFRIPDVLVCDFAAFDPSGVWLRTAVVVVEIRSPREPHEEKLPFYAERGIPDVLLVDPELRSLRWLALGPSGGYEPIERSEVLGLAAADVAAAIRWD